MRKLSKTQLEHANLLSVGYWTGVVVMICFGIVFVVVMTIALAGVYSAIVNAQRGMAVLLTLLVVVAVLVFGPMTSGGLAALKSIRNQVDELKYGRFLGNRMTSETALVHELQSKKLAKLERKGQFTCFAEILGKGKYVLVATKYSREPNPNYIFLSAKSFFGILEAGSFRRLHGSPRVWATLVRMVNSAPKMMPTRIIEYGVLTQADREEISSYVKGEIKSFA